MYRRRQECILSRTNILPLPIIRQAMIQFPEFPHRFNNIMKELIQLLVHLQKMNVRRNHK